MPNKKKLYEALKAEGYDNFADESSFNAYVDNADNRKKLFSALKQEGYDNFADETEFEKYLGYNSEDNAAFEANAERFRSGQPIERVTTQSVIDANPELGLQQPIVNPYSAKRASLKEQVDNNNRKFPKMEDLPWAKSLGGTDGHVHTTDLAERLNRTYQDGGMESFLHSEEDEKIKTQYTPKEEKTTADVWGNAMNKFALTERGGQLQSELDQIQSEITEKYLKEFSESEEYKQLSSKKYTSREEAKKADKVANDLFNAKYAEAISNDMQPYMQAYNNEVMHRYGADVESGLNNIAKKEAAETLGNLSTSVDADLEKIEDAITSRQKSVRNIDWKPGMPSSRDDAKLTELRGQRTYLEGAKELIEDSQNILNAVEAEKDGSFFGGLGRGVRDKAFDIDTWTMGLSDLVGGLRLKSVLEKAEKGETLTTAEQKLLDASVNNMAVNFYYRNDLGLGYQAGEITGQSIPFMLEFLVNPVSASGNAMAKRLLTYGLKRFGSAVNSKAIKAGTRLATDALAAGGVTATTGMGHVLSGGVERLNRNYEYGLDEEGNLNVVNTHNMGVGEAFAKSATSAFLERQSEMIFNAFRGAPSLFKGIETSLPGGVNTFMNYVINSRLGELWKGIKNNATMKELAKRTQFHGLGEEYLEEVYNNFANIPLGEMTFEEATDLENNIVTFLGLAPTQVMFSAIGGIGYGVERYKARRDLERTFGKMTEEQKRKLMELQEMGKLSTNKDIAFFLAETIKDESLTPEQKRAEIEYAYNLAKQNAIDEVSNTDLENTIESENVAIDAVTNLSTGEYIEVDRWVVDAETGVRVPQPGNIVGWIGEAPVFVPEGMENTEENRIVLKPNEWNPETVQRMPAEEVKAINEEMIREEAAQQAEMEAKYAPEVLNAQMQQGVPFNTPTSQIVPVAPMPEGNGWIVEEYALDTNNKVAKTPIVRELTNDEYRDMLQAQLNAEEAAQEQIAAEGQAAAPEVVEEVQPTEEADVKENFTTETGNNLSPVEEVAQPQAEVKPQTPVIPTKEDGSIDFVSYGKEGTFKTLGEKYGEKMPNKVAVTAKALAEDLKNAQNKLQKAEEAYGNAPIGREQKAEGARDKAKQELEAIQREANFWAEMDAEIKDAQARRESMLNPQAEVETSTEPMNVDEFVAQQLASGNIILDKEDYKKETGYGDEEANAMNGGATKLFGKNGMTIQEAGERLMEIDRENGTNFFDQLDSNSGRDALINVLGSVKSRKELNQYIASNRSEQAKRESEGLRNELEKQAMEANYASLEDYVLQMEAAEVENPFMEDRAEEIMAIFAEEAAKYEQSLNNIENGQGTTNEVAEGSDTVLSEEQSDNTGGTEELSEPERIGDGTSEESEGTYAEEVKESLRNRAKDWENKLGVKVNLIESIDQVTNREALRAIQNGQIVTGWFEESTGEVCFYMPYLESENEVDSTYIHEVVAHKGLRGLLGDKFDAFCDEVWDVMSNADRLKFMAYPGVSHLEGKERSRAAADEYIAHLAETIDVTEPVWSKLTELIKKFLKAIGLEPKMTNADIANTIKRSYQRLFEGEGGASLVGEGTRFNAKKVSERRQDRNRVNNTVDQAVAFVTGKDVKEVKAERLGKELKRKEEAEEIYQSVLSGDFNDVTLQKINDYIDDATPLHPYGQRISQRLPQKLERGLHEGARTNAVDALFSRICESAVPASRRASEAGRREIEERKKEALKGWAIATNNWHTDLSDFADEEDFIRQGTDSKVYLAKDGKHVIKVSFGKPEGKRFRPDIDTIALFNSVFRNTAYEIVGYGEFDGKFARILKQPFVDFADKTALNADEREEYMRTLGFEPINESRTAFSNGSIIAADLQKSNILKDAAGNISVIDADMKLHTKDVGGNYTYPPVEADLPEGKLSFRVVNDKNGRKTLVGLHNISEAKLKKAIKQGGLANPSMAVIDMDKQSHVDYGDITLVAPESLVDKKLGKNVGTYMADAYTPIYPTVVKQMTDKGYKAFNKALDDVNEFFRSKVRSYFNSYLDTGTIYDALYYWYLSDTGKNPPTLEAALPSDFTREEVDKVKSINPEADSFFQLSEEDKQKALSLYAERYYNGIEAYKEYLTDYIKRMQEVVKDESKPAMVRNRIQRNLNEIENYGFEYDYVAAYYNRGMTLANRQSKPSDVETFSNARNEVVKKGLNDEFNQWLVNKESDLGVEEKLFKGYDNQGRAKYVPNTLENASKLMKKEGRAGATGYGGFNEFVAVLVPVAKTTKELNKKKQNLSTKEAYDEFVEQWSGHYHDLAQKLQPGADKWADYGYHRLQEIAPMANPRDYVKREYGIELSDEFIKDLNDIKTAIKNDFPARYFETKFERPVYLNEFAAAVVPSDMGLDLYGQLQRMGIPMYEYERGNNEARMAAVDKVASETKGVRFRVKSFETANEELDKDGISINNKELMDEYGLSDITLSKSGNHVTLSKVVVEDKGKGNGTRFMEDLTNTADNNGWILALTPDTSFGGSSVARLKKFYKRFGFKDNKGRYTDFETRESMVRPVGGTRFRVVGEPAIDYVSQANDVVEVPKDEVMYTMSNIAPQLYKTSGRFMRELYKYGTIGRVLKGEYAEIDQIKAKNEYDHAKPILEEYLNELVWMKYHATEAAQEVINDVISDVEYAMQYYKDLSLGKDVWRTQSSPRFRISEKGKQIQAEVDKFTSKYNSKPVVASEVNSMADEDIEDMFDADASEVKDAAEKGMIGGYDEKTDKIYIFAENQNLDDLEDTLFHENLHALFHGNAMIVGFDEASKDKFLKNRANIQKVYKEDMWAEEMFVKVAADAMAKGDFKYIEKYLPDEYKEEFYNTIKDFGYEREEESERRRTVRPGIGGQVEGQEVSQTRGLGEDAKEPQAEQLDPRERKERLTDLFNKVADMGLEGVLGNKEYTSAMVDIYKALPNEVRAGLADDALRNYGGSVAPAVSDYLNVKAEPSVWDKVVTIVREALRKVGFDLDLNTNEVRYMVWRSKKPLDRNNLLEAAEDIDMKNRLKVGEYDGSPTPDSGGTRFRVSNKLKVRDEYEATIKKGGYQAREAVQDAMLSLRKFQELIEKASGKKIRDFENAWIHENRLSSVVQAEIHDMERKFYKPMMDAVKKVMKAANLEQEQVADYLMLKHGIERNREMAVRKALTDDQGKIDRTRLEQWYQEKEAIRNDASLDTWRKKQEAMDNAALNYGADMSRDYSGLTSMFGTDDLADSTQKAYDEVEALENAHSVETESLGKAIKAMTQNTLDKSFESGLMDRKVYDELSKDMYDYYIPLRGFEETTSEEVYAYLDQDRGAFNAPLKRAKGRSSKSDNPIAYLKSIAESGIMQGNRNKMKQSFLNMVINHPSDLVSVREGVWVTYNPTTGEWEVATPPAIPNDATPADVEAAMEAWEQQMEQAALKDPTLVKKVAEAADVPYRVVGNKMDQHQIIVKRLGKSYTLTINGNPRLAMALNGQTNPNNTSNDGKVAAFVNNKIGSINRSLAAWYTTRNPDFVASNFMRDTFYTNTIVRAKEGNKYANKFHKNYATVLPKMLGLFRKYENGTLDPANPTEAAFLDFMMNGGETGYSNLKDVEEIKKQIAKELKESKWDKAVTAIKLESLRWENIEAIAEKLDILNRAVENTARFAAFLTSREEGRSIAKSVFDAKEISVNFNKKGAGGTFFGATGQTKLGNLAAMVGAGGRALYVFFNAAIQGSTNLMHVMKVNPKGTSAGLAAMFLMGAVVPFLFGGDDDEKDYYDLPEHVRRNHLIIPGAGDAWVSIPLPIEYRIMYGIGELLTSWRTGHERGTDIARKMLSMTGQALPLNFLEEGLEAFVPSAISPIYQVMTNSSWTGLPIYKENDFNKDDPEYTKAYSNVDRNLLKFTKALYEWSFDEENQKERIDLNPAIIETLAKGYFGGLATQLSNIAKVGGMIAGEQEFDWRNIPIGNRILKTGDERTKEKRVTNEYFENMEKLDFLQSRERMLKKTEKGVAVPEADKFKAQKDLETMQGTEVYKKYQEFKKQKKVVDKIRKTIKEKGSTPEREKQLMEAQEAANKAVR